MGFNLPVFAHMQGVPVITLSLSHCRFLQHLAASQFPASLQAFATALPPSLTDLLHCDSSEQIVVKPVPQLCGLTAPWLDW